MLGKHTQKIIVVLNAVVLSAFLLWGRASLACGIDWVLPTYEFEGVSEQGSVSLWKSIATIRMEEDEDLPIFINFRSDNETAGIGGYGWSIPILEANIIQVDEQSYVATLPNGIRMLFLKRVGSTNEIASTKAWMGEIFENSVKLSASCGWSIIYKNGRLSSFTSPKGLTYQILFDGKTPAGISVGGKNILTTTFDPETGMANRILLKDQSIDLDMGVRPVFGVQDGKIVVRKIVNSLQGISVNREKKYEFLYASESSKPQTGYILEKNLLLDKDSERSWDISSSRIIADDNWVYSFLGGHPRDLSVKSFFEMPYMQRYNGTDTEGYFDNLIQSEELTVKSGVTRISQRFASGTVKGKVRKVSEIRGGVRRDVYRASYDDQGRLLRQSDRLFETGDNAEKWDRTLTLRYEGGKLIATLARGGEKKSIILDTDKENDTNATQISEK